METTVDFRQPLQKLGSLISRRQRELESPSSRNSLASRLHEVFLQTWDLGFTSFGGPPVHFQIIHARFVEERSGNMWVDEQTYQELFAICQGLPGPGSTKMLFCVTLLHAGFIPALLAFILWSSPGALAMYSLSLGVQRMSDVLPSPVYALLSGLNASTVGIIALAAVQLAEKAIKNDFTRILVIFGACAGVCYNALWYFPTLMVIGGLAGWLWDGYVSSSLARYRSHRRSRSSPVGFVENAVPIETIAAPGVATTSTAVQRRTNAINPNVPSTEVLERTATTDASATTDHVIKVRVGISVLVIFFASFTAVLLLRGLLHPPPLVFSLFANMYLAGTIIFGGGPVVIPLLRTYVVDPGWVSGRDFLIGLAIIQAMPGPNFNFVVYLGALALRNSHLPTILGAFVAFVGIFLPGVTLAVAVQGFWRVLRTRKWVVDILRGVNATAVGLVFTAVYRLWEIGYLTPQVNTGQSLALNPWWIVVATTFYAGSAWFKVPPPLAIVTGAVLGLCWYGAVGRQRFEI